MPIVNNNFEKLPLQLKHISVHKIKNIADNTMFKREYEATRTENQLAADIHAHTNGLFGIKPTIEFWSPVDFIIYNFDLNLKFYVELKNRQIEDKYDTLIIGKSKICTIVNEELYPTFVVNTFRDSCYVYMIEDEDFLTKFHRDDKNIYVPKSICFSYTEFIDILMTLGYTAFNHKQLNCTEIIP